MTQDPSDSEQQSPASSAILDTNVVLDWMVFQDLRVKALVDAIEAGSVRWHSCPRMRQEFVHMLAHQSMAKWSPAIEACTLRYDRLATMHPDPGLPTAAGHSIRCSDVDDQVFVELALLSRAQWLITHDRALLRLARRLRARGVEVMSPARWSLQPWPPDLPLVR